MATGFTVMDAMGERSKAGASDKPKARFRTKDIQISKMYRNEKNFYSLDGIEKLAGEILMLGMQQNLEVVYEPTEEGDYRIVAGERRWLALNLLVKQGYTEFETATCKITAPKDEDEEQIEIIVANAYREKTMPDIIEETKRLKEALENMKKKNKKILGYDLTTGRLRDVVADMLHLSKTKVGQIDAINSSLIPEFREELKAGRLNFSAAYVLAGVSRETQEDLFEQYQKDGGLTYTEAKKIRQEDEENQQIPGQTDIGDFPEYLPDGMENQERPGQQLGDVSESDTEYETPHPEGITSLCYSCTEYETCNVKTGTCTACDKYQNRAEAYKTDEERYNEEQDEIDRQTKKKLREMADEEKMNDLPSDREDKTEKITVSGSEYDRMIVKEEQPYIILYGEEYKTGMIVELVEHEAGSPTGRSTKVKITHIDTSETSSAVNDGYSIVAIKPEVEAEKIIGEYHDLLTGEIEVREW